MNNISKISDCYGCGVCATSCSKKIINIKLNGDGFYQPYINDFDKCTECGICLDVCAFNHDELSLKDKKIIAWAAWSDDQDIRRKCSSGGIGFEIAKQLIEKGYLSVVCRYDTCKQRAEHYIATTVEELVQSIGSKYIQSYTVEAFQQIKKRGQNYLVVGTPCQIDSFRRMIRKFNCESNFLLMDFFCHCVPSMHAWKAYLKMLEPKVGTVTYVSWRNKFEYGWHDSWLMGIDGTKTSSPIDVGKSYQLLKKERQTAYKSRMSQGDMFYKLFLGDLCLGVQCEEHCKYKYDQSSADIRIGDLWGNTYQDNQEGVSAVVSFTDKGAQLIQHLDGVTLVEHPFSLVAEGQMKENAKHKAMKPLIMFLLRNNVSLNSIPFKCVLFFQRVISRLSR